MNRRRFLAALGILPFAGSAAPKIAAPIAQAAIAVRNWTEWHTSYDIVHSCWVSMRNLLAEDGHYFIQFASSSLKTFHEGGQKAVERELRKDQWLADHRVTFCGYPLTTWRGWTYNMEKPA